MHSDGCRAILHLDHTGTSIISQHLARSIHKKERVRDRLSIEPAGRRVVVAVNRPLQTSATQFYRLLDQTNSRKSIDQLLSLLHVLDCDIELLVRTKAAHRKAA